MNETLKFSWGHIIAFLALIAVSYVSFIGYAYLSAGNFFFAIAAMVVTDLVFFALFMGIQILKSDGNKIDRKIMWERILVFVSPLVFVGCMVGFAHFWTIKTQDSEIVNAFISSVNNSKQMFSDYENYSLNRISSYDATLTKIIEEKGFNPVNFKKAGFLNGYEMVQKENMIEVLRLQLLSDNYNNLKENAYKWIDKANQGTSTWNVFLIGNTREIKEALRNWEKDLKHQAGKKLVAEEVYAPIEDFKSNGAIKAIEGLDKMSSTFDQWKFPVWQAFFFGIIIYFLLLFPYFLQPRHTRQVAGGLSLFQSKEGVRPLENSQIADSQYRRETENNGAFSNFSKKSFSTNNHNTTTQGADQNVESHVSVSPMENKLKQLKKRTL